MCAYSDCRNEFLVIINSHVEFDPTVRGLISSAIFSFSGCKLSTRYSRADLVTGCLGRFEIELYLFEVSAYKYK